MATLRRVQIALCALAIVALCAAVVFDDWQRMVLAVAVAVVLTTLAVYL